MYGLVMDLTHRSMASKAEKFTVTHSVAVPDLYPWIDRRARPSWKRRLFCANRAR